ncbi:hypothetical protein J4Q44_G00393150, partial [Coregonus suidteri]
MFLSALLSAKLPSLPRSPAKHPSPVKSTPMVSSLVLSILPTVWTVMDTPAKRAQLSDLCLFRTTLAQGRRGLSQPPEARTLPRASSATRGSEETQGARGERGALVNMELLGLPNIGNTCSLTPPCSAFWSCLTSQRKSYARNNSGVLPLLQPAQ